MATVIKPQPLKLETPLSATFPSEIQSPAMAMSPALVKREDVEKTPITPPVAYLSFLSKMSSTSPPPSATFKIPEAGERPSLTSHPSVESVASTATTMSDSSIASTVDSVATEKTQTNQSEVSTTSASTIEVERSSNAAEAPAQAASSSSSAASRLRSASGAEHTTMGKPLAKPCPRPVTIPKSPFSPGPESARSLGRLHIPQSPYSPCMASPSMTSPMIASPLSAGVLISPYSAATHTYFPRERDFGAGAVGMRQTITRYISIPNKSAPVMEPVPASKKRKIEQA